MVMHNSAAVQRWQGVVEPGLSATIRVIYRPSLMPVEGSVARNVKFATNDPSRPVVELGVHATVQRDRHGKSQEGRRDTNEPDRNSIIRSPPEAAVRRRVGDPADRLGIVPPRLGTGDRKSTRLNSSH